MVQWGRRCCACQGLGFYVESGGDVAEGGGGEGSGIVGEVACFRKNVPLPWKYGELAGSSYYSGLLEAEGIEGKGKRVPGFDGEMHGFGFNDE